VGELHTAVVELSARLRKGDIEFTWLPRHTFIVLSQIQGHAAALLEDLDSDKAPPENELEAMDNSLDSMIETYEDMKELLDDALDRFRRHNLSVVKPRGDGGDGVRIMMQISVGGTGVWRRVLVPSSWRLKDLHRIIQAVLGWKDSFGYRFSVENSGNISGISLDERLELGRLGGQGMTEIIYEYGSKWTVKILVLSRDGEKGETAQCVAGEGAAPPESVEGPLRFRRILYSLENGGENEKNAALNELGKGFKPDLFDPEICNKRLGSLDSVKIAKRGPYEKRK
jgi:hypothetical protein